MISALLAQRKWAFFGLEQSFLTVINPLRYFHIWNNRRIMDNYISKEMDERYLSKKGVTEDRTIIDLALSAYRSENSIGHREPLDPTFRKYAISQMKVFIFAGHDANSTTICYSWILLSRNPGAMAKVRAEHDAVLGSDASEAAETLIRDPSLLNQLPYTLAVIKETLRLFPAVSSARMGLSGFTLTDSQGRQFPTQNCLVWANHHGVHNNPSWWKRVDEFLPERWLPESNGTDLHPIKNAWRPFEFGPRACIGVELALMEIKVVLALTLREFDLEEAYEEWDRLNKSSGIKTVNGERAYQIQLGSAHPADGFPVRMRCR
jgi:cytochrome P450